MGLIFGPILLLVVYLLCKFEDRETPYKRARYELFVKNFDGKLSNEEYLKETIELDIKKTRGEIK